MTLNKKEQVKRIMYIMFFMLLWLLSAMRDSVVYGLEAEEILFIVSAFAACVVVSAVKDNYIFYFVAILLVAVLNVKSIDYLLMMLPFAFLLCVYKECLSKSTAKNQEGYAFWIFVVLTVFILIFLLLYTVIKLKSPITSSYFTDFLHLDYLFASLIVILLPLRTIIKYCKAENKERVFYKRLCICHLLYAVAFAELIFYCYVTFGMMKFSPRIVLFPVFICMCIMIYNDEPAIKSLFEKISYKISEISEKNR